MECLQCGTSFTATTAREVPDRKFCTRECGNRYQFAKKYAAGGGRRQGYVGGKSRLAIFERDDWRCRLCGAPIDRSQRFPSPGSASIDHIVPLADGGPHDPTNWQATHLICNIDKGNLDRKRKVA
jgi:5-methylcytosine-specific restriction endonuclease McrA